MNFMCCLNMGFNFIILKMVKNRYNRNNNSHVRLFYCINTCCLHDVTVIQESVVTVTGHLTNVFVRENVAGSYDSVSTL